MPAVVWARGGGPRPHFPSPAGAARDGAAGSKATLGSFGMSFFLFLLLFGLLWLGLALALSSPILAFFIALVFTAWLAAMEGPDKA